MTKEEFIKEYESAPEEMSKEEFRRVFAAGRELLSNSYTDRQLGEAVGGSKGTIERWLNGTTCPAPLSRKVYIRKLVRIVR